MCLNNPMRLLLDLIVSIAQAKSKEFLNEVLKCLKLSELRMKGYYLEVLYL